MKVNRIVVDAETTPKGDLVLNGVMDSKYKYRYFTNAQDLYDYLKKDKIKEVFCHNLEFDFFKNIRYLPQVKYACYFSTANLSYVQMGNIFWKDLFNHLPYSLANIGHLLRIEKLEIDYDKIEKVTPELIEYNKRDCLITMTAVNRLGEIYRKEGCPGIKSTSGAQALYIFLHRHNAIRLSPVNMKHIDTWRKGYHGGWVEAFKTGNFRGQHFYKIDMNSQYPYLSMQSLPSPYSYKIKKKISNYERHNYYWLGIKNDESGTSVYNSVEHREVPCDRYYVFYKRLYPFRSFTKYFYDKRTSAQDLFDKEVYKRLLNSLTGKFGQRNETEIISNYNYKMSKNIIAKEPYCGNLYKIRMKDVFRKFWVNVIWILFLTAKARHYMSRMKDYLERKGMTVYYIDTDAFIVSGEIENIRHIINKNKLGMFKLEDIADSIEIKGKKMYRFGNKYVCKGVPADLRKEFFENAEVFFKRMVKYRESIVRNVNMGSWVQTKKTNKNNNPGIWS